MVRVLGPVEIDGWVQRPRRSVVTELVTYLACHDDRPVSTDRLRDALTRTSDDAPISDTTLRTYMSAVRTAVGTDHLPDATGAGGYRLAGVDCDWTRFLTLTAPAERAISDSDRIGLLDDAVGLVRRGRPFADGTAWAEREGLPAVIEARIVAATGTLGRLHLRAGNAQAALAVVGIGLDVRLGDEALAVTGLDAAHATGRLAGFYTDLAGRLEANGDGLSPAVTAHHRQLRQHPPRPV